MNTKNKTIILAIVIIIVSFYGGYTYGKNVTSNRATGQLISANGMTANRPQNGMGIRGGMRNSGFTGGEIIAKDEKSITVKLPNGGSTIILFSPSTSIQKSTTGSATDLNIGEQVTVTGNTNSDGSISAQSVQIRPAGFATSTQR